MAGFQKFPVPRSWFGQFWIVNKNHKIIGFHLFTSIALMSFLTYRVLMLFNVISFD